MTQTSFMLRNLVLPIGDHLFGQRMMSRLRFLEKAQWWDENRINTFQQKELSKLLKIAYLEVPFYRNLFDTANISPEKIKSTDELLQLPVINKDMLREGYPDQTTRPTGHKTYEASTSGSTGKNFFVMEDAYTAGWYRASFMLSLEWAGWQIGEPHLQTGMTLKRSFDRRLKDRMLGCHYFSSFNLDDTHLDKILEEMDLYKIKHLWGYPASLYYIAKRAIALGWSQPLISTVSWGDSLYPHYRKTIEDAFQTKTFDTYGCAEGIQIAAQCEVGNYHLHALDAVVEFLDEAGQPVQAGEVGNIVVTRLHPGPMPLIRYAIGDLGVPGGTQTCSCGRGFPLLRSIQGRNADVVLTPSGNRLIVHFFTGILEHFPEIDSFQVEQTEVDRIIVRIVPSSEIPDSLSIRVVNALKEKGANDLQINIEFVSNIPLPPSGKHRFVISNIKQP